MGKTKRTYQPSKVRRARKFGFRARKQTVGGKRTIKARRRKGRSYLSPATMGNNKVEKNKRISRRR